METHTISLTANEFVKASEAIASVTVDLAIARAEKRLAVWRNKSYDERAAQLHEIAGQVRDEKDELSMLITVEIDKLLASAVVK